jgi:DNA polymerase-1
MDVLGVKRIENDEYEADDILGSIAEQMSGKDLEVILVTGDKDALQLVNENVKVYANKKGISEYEIYDIEAVKEKIHLLPEQVVDYMALTGDTSDNIPGVRGIGEKTARKLLGKYESLDNLYDKIDEITGRQKTMLADNIDMAYLSRELVTIKRDVKLDLDIESLLYGGTESEQAREYFSSIEMHSLIKDFFHGEGEEKEEADIVSEKNIIYEVIRTEERLKEVIEIIKKKGEVAVDTETTSLLHVEARLVGISLSVEEREGWYIPMQSRGLFSEEYLDGSISLYLLKPLLEDESIQKIGHNFKYDLVVLRKAGVDVKGVFFDTMVASYLLNPGERRHNMDDLALKYLNHRNITYKEVVGSGKNRVPIEEVPLEKLAEYAIEDADITYRLYKLFKPGLVENELDSLFYNIEMPLVMVLADMEMNGVKIDGKYFAALGRTNERMLEGVVKDIFREAGEEFNINSTRELARILFTKLGLKSKKKTKTGLSTDITVLEALRGDHAIIDHLISYRTLSKFKSTYIDALPNIVSSETGRIHTSYNQTVAVTGRLSSSNPNLQNIPIKDELGRDIRKGFVPEKEYLLMSADYSQIELRLAAHLSGDENMIKAFKDGIDIHNLTASRVNGVEIESIGSDMRRQAKIINFAIIYGVSPYGLAQQADIGVKEAAWFIKIYFETYPGFKEYMDTTIGFAREHGYVKTMLGRKRDIPEINSSVSFRREGAERAAINTPIQGTSADMIKIAMIDINSFINEKGLKSRMIMQVHDELVFEVHRSEKELVEKTVREKMEQAIELQVPVIVDIGWGKNWDEAH